MGAEDKLDCNESQSLMAAYLDGELDASAVIAYRAHLETCEDCAQAHRQMKKLQATIKDHGVRYAAPNHLRQRIKAELSQTTPPARKFGNLPRAWINLGVATFCSLTLAVALTLYFSVPSLQDRIEDEVVASHARSLMETHLSDVVSTDQHTVKPWFSGKLDYSPTVVDFAQQGFALVGGRLDYLNHRPVAAMAYRHRLHVLNLFVWPTTAQNDTPSITASRQGYQLVHWTQSGMCYWLISDMNVQDLTEFKRLLSEQIAKDNKQ